uniref:Protein kinase domain-containing protein n=1 Tax=Coccolithus braarudii TaxID=221442 RepID=A0A7S0L8D2_9EUKA
MRSRSSIPQHSMAFPDVRPSSAQREMLERVFAQFSLSEIVRQKRIGADEIILGSCLGQGSYGVVRVSKWQGRLVATKSAHKSCLGEREVRNALRASELHLKLPRHDNVIELYGLSWSAEQGMLMLVMELVAGMNLAQVIEKEHPMAIPEPKQIHIALGIARGLAFLHEVPDKISRPLIHRDLKPDNILIGSTGQVKIADFGTSRPAALTASPLMSTITHGVGAPAFSAPECLNCSTYDHRVDIWSYGCILSCMGNGWSLPFCTKWLPDGQGSLLSRLANGALKPDVPETSVFRPLVRDCCQYDPACRTSAAAVVLQLEALQ